MSAAGRSEVRRADDFYSTPAWVTRAILPKFRELLGPDVTELIHGAKRAGPASRAVVVDPCAGDGAILEVVRDCFPGRVFPVGVELDPLRARVCRAREISCLEGNSLLADVDWGNPALVIANPPFSLAFEFAETAMIYRRAGAVVAFLFRLNWLEGAKRAAFHQKWPADIFVLPHRPSFTGDGKTDATAYAWFVWGLSEEGGHWEILDCPDRRAPSAGKETNHVE